VGQVPLLQVPSQPSDAPQALPVQEGSQQSQAIPLLMHFMLEAGQPLQMLPQLSAAPQPLPTQFGWHLQLP
jgi:hypothetical protein